MSDKTICANCGHSKEAHWDRYGCEVEGPDVWIEGKDCGGLVASGPCGCLSFEVSESEEAKRFERMEQDYWDRRSGA